MFDTALRLNAALEGRYRIERELGEGGMATVYLADDVRHDRKVAIKVLKPELSAVIGAKRFLAEIRTTANLQHPHILALFDSGEADGLLFYVMPFIEGESLRDRLDRDRQLPVDEAIRMAAAVAGALDYAHRHGVIHRDIKPANILIHDGQPVVADFGIALAVSAAGGGRLTETGLSLGTPHYMSPEQATADRELNAQSDIYALGCVTYEMFTGAPPFSGPTAQSILMQILTEDAKPVTAVRKAVPPHVEAAVARALEKLPADRFKTAGDFATALREPGTIPMSARRRGPASPTGAGWRSVLWPAAAAVLAVVAVVGWMDAPAAPGAVARLGVSTPNERGEVTQPDAIAISPDGRTLAYQAELTSGDLGLLVRSLESYESRVVFPFQYQSATFSPDGSELAVFDGAQLRILSLTGSSESVVASEVGNGSRLAWTDRGIYYTDPSGRLARVPASGGPPELLSSDTTEAIWMLAPLEEVGGALIFHGVSGTIHFYDFASRELTPLSEADWAWMVGGKFLTMLRGDRLVARRFDVESRQLVGPEVVVVEGVATRFGFPLVDVSASGTLLYVSAAGEDVLGDMVSISRSGMRVDHAVDVSTNLGFSLSPDGTRIVYEEGTGIGGDIYVLELATGNATRLTFDRVAAYPTWHPDGDRVAYYAIRDGEYALYSRAADGSGVEEVLLDGPGREIEVRYLPDGERILVREGDQRQQDGADLILYTVGDPDSGREIAAGPGNELGPQISPDGRYVAYASDELGEAVHVFVRSLDDPRERWQVSDGTGGIEPLWNRDGTELFYRRPTSLARVPVSIDPSFRVTGPATDLFRTTGFFTNSNHTSYALMPDGETFLFLRTYDEGDTRIVLNWVEELRERLGG